MVLGTAVDEIDDIVNDKFIASKITRKMRPKGTKRLQVVFDMFCDFNQRGPRKQKAGYMPSSKFIKLCMECGLVVRLTHDASAHHAPNSNVR